jgi:hypothetical protein
VAHGWAIKHWRLSQLTTLEGYIQQNLDMMLLPLVTPKGRRAFDRTEKPLARYARKPA